MIQNWKHNTIYGLIWLVENHFLLGQDNPGSLALDSNAG